MNKYEKFSKIIRLFLVIAFIVLKLTGVVDLSWWWISLPIFVFIY